MPQKTLKNVQTCVGLNPDAEDLSTSEGARNALADIYRTLKTGGHTRDEVAALRLQANVVKDIREEAKILEQKQAIEELEKAAKALEQQLGSRDSGLQRIADAPAVRKESHRKPN